MKVITIGRSSQNEVVLLDPNVSRHHCQIILHDDGHYSIADFGSTNGTFVNGRRIQGETVLNPGDVVIVEIPTFVHAVETFEMFEAKCIGVEMDEDGMCMDDLEKKIQQYKPKMIYVIPTFQNPSGRTLTLERRKKIAELADQ